MGCNRLCLCSVPFCVSATFFYTQYEDPSTRCSYIAADPTQLKYIINHSESKAIVVSGEFLSRVITRSVIFALLTGKFRPWRFYQSVP